jgi:hypothetical protein
MKFKRKKQRRRVAGSIIEHLNDLQRIQQKSQKIQAVPNPTVKVKSYRKANKCLLIVFIKAAALANHII